jgi:hypothetical protein
LFTRTPCGGRLAVNTIPYGDATTLTGADMRRQASSVLEPAHPAVHPAKTGQPRFVFYEEPGVFRPNGPALAVLWLTSVALLVAGTLGDIVILVASGAVLAADNSWQAIRLAVRRRRSPRI